jgi:hypothetical protein
MVWVMRVFPPHYDFSIQQEFKEHFLSAGSPKDMMLIFVGKPQETQFYMLLPDNSWLTKFGGFLPISEEMLPKEAALLVGHADEFEKRFRYIKR